MKHVMIYCRNFSLGVLAAALLAVAGGGLSQPVGAVSGGDWRVGRIIDDTIFYNKSSMSIEQIQQFLNAKVPTCDNWGSQPHAGTTRRAYSEARGIKFPLTCLRDYHENTTTKQNNLEGRPVPAGSKGAAQIIWEAAQQYSISPQALIVLLQKEQALVLDDWPWPIQFRSATGYGCPDSAPCDSDYYGFYNQVNNAARQFRRYATFPNDYNHIPGTGNFIQYNPNAGCGGTGVTIENLATAGLYNYTPYQPNQAALNNLYGSGDSCSAYGNRNFWRTFNDWFGPTRAGEPMVVQPDNGDPRQYVLVDNRLYYIPSVEVKLAWNLDRYVLVHLTGDYMGSLPQGPTITRLTRPHHGAATYLVDSGVRYYIPSSEMMAAWNYTPSDVADLPQSLTNMLPVGPTLPAIVREPNNGPGIYLIDGAARRHLDSLDTVTSWQGNSSVPISVSQGLFDRFSNGSDITSFKVQTSGGSQFIVNGGYKLPAAASMADAFPGSATTVSDATVNRLTTGPAPTNFIKANTGDPAVYLLDAGQKRSLSTLNLFNSWTNSGQRPVTIMTSGHLNKMADGSAVQNRFAANIGQTSVYFVDGSKLPIPSNLRQAYLGSQSPTTVSDQVLNVLDTGATASRYLQTPGASTIYGLDSGSRKNFMAWDDFRMWGGTPSTITWVSANAMGQFGQNGAATSRISDGTNTYLLTQPGTLYQTTQNAVKNWQLPAPTSVTSDMFASFTNSGSTLPDVFKIGNKNYLLRNGTGYGSDNANLLSLWTINSSGPSFDASVKRFFAERNLTRFTMSSAQNDGKVYLVSENTYLYVSAPTQLLNLGYNGEGMVDLDAADLTGRGVTSWNNTLVKDGGSSYYLLDTGAKRQINSDAVSQWTNNQTLSTQTVSNAFLNLYTSGSNVAKAIRSSESPQVFAGSNGEKRWITSYQQFVDQYAPETVVSKLFKDSLPTGAPL